MNFELNFCKHNLKLKILKISQTFEPQCIFKGSTVNAEIHVILTPTHSWMIYD